MTHQDSWTTRLKNYIADVLPWTHGHQLKGISTFVGAIIEKQTGNQAELVSLNELVSRSFVFCVRRRFWPSA